MNTIEIGVEVVRVHCENCGEVFEHNTFSQYGILDFYTEDGSTIVVVVTAGDPTCEEIVAFIDKICSNISIDQRSKCFRQVLIDAVDRINGKRIDPFYKIRCIFCGSFSLEITSYDPAKFAVVSYPLATSSQWMQYNQQEREAIMSNIIHEKCQTQ